MMVYRSEAEQELVDVEENVQHLTVGIPDVATYKVPRHYQCHIMGISEWFVRLLHRVAHAIACYDAQQEDQFVLIFFFVYVLLKALELHIFPYVFMNYELFMVLKF